MKRIGTKPIDSQEVFCQAVKLFRNQGTATTLEVKEKLRDRGFFAIQNEVSAMMLFLANRHGWKAELKGHPEHIEYSWPERNKICISYWRNQKSIANFIAIVELMFLLILAYITFEWVKNPGNDNYEPLIGLIASGLAIFQWFIYFISQRNIFSKKE